jgi:hypothetical protein
VNVHTHTTHHIIKVEWLAEVSSMNPTSNRTHTIKIITNRDRSYVDMYLVAAPFAHVPTTHMIV